MTDPNTPAADSRPDPATITCWRDVVSAFRHREFRLPVTFALIVVAEAYLLCLAVALLVGAAVYAWVVSPALTGVFGRVPAPFAVQLAMGAVAGGPLFWGNVWLMYRIAGRLTSRRTKPTGGRDDV
jgi:hypothetical protein